ncbi:MAG: riboflavin biosynthesis protein RibF [Phycisphaera sp.]|nr:riboflavin biosynthesis protein RibF [Phycisphaera sp.]
MVEPCVLAIGNFDGVHLGHRSILHRAHELAETGPWPVRVMTFDPHPYRFLRPSLEPLRITTIAQRVRYLREAGADDVTAVKTTPEFLSTSAHEFVADLIARYAPRAIVEGPDFRFGKGRVGDAALLRQMGGKNGFEVHVVDRCEVSLHDLLRVTVSSSLVRYLVTHGRVADAQKCLGRPFEIEGKVVTGERRGRTIGFPTVNLQLEDADRTLVPTNGVYAGLAVIEGSVDPLAAAISIGSKPTFGGVVSAIEAHLVGYRGELYGQRVTLRFTRYLRDQQPFPSVDTLKSQLARDVARAARESGSHWARL